MPRILLVSLALLGLGTAAQAAPVNGSGLVTPDAIFGSGNANGSFTGTPSVPFPPFPTLDGASSTSSASTFLPGLGPIELGLRGKLRYNNSGSPENTFNYDGNRTYTFSPADSNAPANRSAFNFEWSINTQPYWPGPGDTAPAQVSLEDDPNVLPAPEDPFITLDMLTYELRIDYDPTTGTDFVAFDPINVPFADHSIGNNSTENGEGVEATNAAEYQALIAQNNVAQNSWNLGFFEPPGFDPQTEGVFTVELDAYLSPDSILALGHASAFYDGDNDDGLVFLPFLVASTSIDIVYGDIPPIPLPASLPLLLGALGIGGVLSRRRRR